ncbi:hypothetical protein Nepgr_019632 [Nepenthes gracilis]|uniref:C2HC zinc finger plants domain-containing protein n=1 Tax=Nepenthes gracilis TaxID=150966 RepID=A0AAD3XVI8_NEPGR|nr:hypothetical protein Nepgr_019632 [Nepenthes gracilis]
MNTASNTTEDKDMMEAEASNAVTASTARNDVIKGLLARARLLVDQGKPSQALQAVVMAMSSSGGEEAVFLILQRARELYRCKLQASAEADQLASLFAECAISEAQPVSIEPSPSPSPSALSPMPDAMSRPSIGPDAYETSILAETGRKQIALDAFSDGSSFICLQCGGLVSNHRKEEHYAYWCQF